MKEIFVHLFLGSVIFAEVKIQENDAKVYKSIQNKWINGMKKGSITSRKHTPDTSQTVQKDCPENSDFSKAERTDVHDLVRWRPHVCLFTLVSERFSNTFICDDP